MHAPDLVICGDDLQICVNPSKIMLLKFHPDVFRNEIDRHSIVPSCPRNDHVRVLATGRHKLIKGWFHKLGVLLNDSTNIPAPLSNIPLDPADCMCVQHRG